MVVSRVVCCALPYINGVPHLGHIVGSHLPADVFARYSRLRGFRTFFVGGSDEHGSPVEIEAEKLGVDLKVFSDKMYGEHKRVYDWFGISYDNFVRTSDGVHHVITQDFFNVLYEKGFVFEREMDSFFSPEDNRFLADRYVVGVCKRCGFDDANGDQCDKCGSVLDVYDLKDPKSKLSGGKLELRKTNHLFFSLSKFADELQSWIEGKGDWDANVRNLVLGWIKDGLKDRCITRDLSNGVGVPLDGFDGKVFYVWFDALIGYISSTKEVADDWEFLWSDSSVRIYNFMGKDNIPFHSVMWPSMLMGHAGFSLPFRVTGLNFLTFKDEKFSKSKGVGVFCHNLFDLGLSSDVWRGYLCSIMPESGDYNFTWDDFKKRVNSDLVGNLGNFVNRVVSFSNERFEGKVVKSKNGTSTDKELFKSVEDCYGKIVTHLEGIEFRKAYSEILKLFDFGNKYIELEEPWKVIKEDKVRANDVFYNCCVLLDVASNLLFPFLPETAVKIRKCLNLNSEFSLKGFKLPSLNDYSVSSMDVLFSKIDLSDKKFENVSKGISLEGFFKK